MQRIEQEERRLDSRLSGHDEKEPSPGPSLPSGRQPAGRGIKKGGAPSFRLKTGGRQGNQRKKCSSADKGQYYMSKIQFSVQDMTREQWLPALACLSPVELRTAVMPILDSYDLEHQALPEDGLGLLQIKDGAWGQSFYLGEFPLASAHIVLRTTQGREFSGAAQYLGDKKEKAVYMAVCDAVLAHNLPESHMVWELVSAGKKKREEIKGQRQAIISRTRVNFDLVSPAQGGSDVD